MEGARPRRRPQRLRQGGRGMKTADDIRRELDGGPNVVVLKVKREPRPEDFIISAVELEAAHFDPVKFVVQGILPVGLAILSAPPKIGKTWMDMSMADALASGEAVSGCKAVH